MKFKPRGDRRRPLAPVEINPMDTYEPVDFSWAAAYVPGDWLANATMLMAWANDFAELGYPMRALWAERQSMKCFDLFWKRSYWRAGGAALTYGQLSERTERQKEATKRAEQLSRGVANHTSSGEQLSL